MLKTVEFILVVFIIIFRVVALPITSGFSPKQTVPRMNFAPNYDLDSILDDLESGDGEFDILQEFNSYIKEVDPNFEEELRKFVGSFS